MPTGAHVHVDGYIGRVWRQVRPRYEFLFLHEACELRLDDLAETVRSLRERRDRAGQSVVLLSLGHRESGLLRSFRSALASVSPGSF